MQNIAPSVPFPVFKSEGEPVCIRYPLHCIINAMGMKLTNVSVSPMHEDLAAHDANNADPGQTMYMYLQGDSDSSDLRLGLG